FHSPGSSVAPSPIGTALSRRCPVRQQTDHEVQVEEGAVSSPRECCLSNFVSTRRISAFSFDSDRGASHRELSYCAESPWIGPQLVLEAEKPRDHPRHERVAGTNRGDDVDSWSVDMDALPITPEQRPAGTQRQRDYPYARAQIDES